MSNGGSLRQIRRRIRSVENTKKITRAMEMIAAAKLRRFQDFLESCRSYTERLEGLLERLLGEAPSDYHHPLLGDGSKRDRSGRLPSSDLSLLEPSPIASPIALVLFTSDTGLCGTYNNEVERLAQDFKNQNSEKKIQFIFVGGHGAHAFRKESVPALATFSNLRMSRIDEILEGLRKTLERVFLGSEVEEVHTIYTRLETLSRYHPTTERILPISKKTSQEGAVQWILEPDAKTVFDKLIPAFFEARLRFIFYHALLTEQIARMTAMRQATQNAEEMIDELTLFRNKARQASITKEIIEVVSGSRALKLK